MSFKNKVVLITGAGRGYGRELAKAFAAQGARLALNDISPMNLNTLVKEIEAEGGEAKAYVQDIAKKVPVQGLVMHVEDDFGKIDIQTPLDFVNTKTASMSNFNKLGSVFPGLFSLTFLFRPWLKILMFLSCLIITIVLLIYLFKGVDRILKYLGGGI